MALVHDVIPPFQLFQPSSVDDALDLLDARGHEAWVIAGGMDSFDWLKDRTKRTASVVELSQVAELRGIRDADGGLEIGAMTTLTEVAEHAGGTRAVRRAGRGGRAGRVAADPQPGHARRQRVAGRALLVLPPRLVVLPRRRQHLLRRFADRGEPRARDSRRRPLRGGEPVGHGAGAHRPRRPDGHPPPGQRARGRTRPTTSSAPTSTSRG